MLKHLTEVKIVATPKDLPVRVVADISGLNVGDVLRVKDLKLDSGVTVLTDAEEALASVSPAR
jgi:large subunit ribosomal protein L25